MCINLYYSISRLQLPQIYIILTKGAEGKGLPSSDIKEQTPSDCYIHTYCLNIYLLVQGRDQDVLALRPLHATLPIVHAVLGNCIADVITFFLTWSPR